MNLHIIIPAVLIAVAAIAGMLILYRWGAFNGAAATQAQVELHGRCLEIDAMKIRFDREQILRIRTATALREAEAQRPHYGRDPKTGRFVKVDHD